jgi:hypothetical protein
MYQEGTIIYFTPYYFSNGKSNSKFFVVLKNIDNSYVLASLPSSQDYIPAYSTLEKGCIDLSDSTFNCFLIPKTEIVTKCGKKFDSKTMLYGRYILKEKIEDLENKYVVKGVNYTVFGEMKEDLFAELIECFKNSEVVKGWVIRDLNR